MEVLRLRGIRCSHNAAAVMQPRERGDSTQSVQNNPVGNKCVGCTFIYCSKVFICSMTTSIFFF